jgi:uncharacterized protein (DUF983 family)
MTETVKSKNNSQSLIVSMSEMYCTCGEGQLVQNYLEEAWECTGCGASFPI